MPDLHLTQSGFTYSICGPFAKHHEAIQKLKETVITDKIFETNSSFHVK